MRRIRSKWMQRVHIHLNSIQFHIAMAFSLLIFIIIITIGWVSYQKYSETLERNAEEYNFQLVEQVKENIDYYIKYMDNISSLVQYNPSVQWYFANQKSKNMQQKQEELEKLQEFFRSFVNVRDDIASIFIFGYNGQVLSSNPIQKIKSNEEVVSLDWYQAAIQAKGSPVISSSHVQTFVDHPRWVVSLSRELRSMNNKEKRGVLLIDLNYKVIDEICKKIKLGKKGYIFIVDLKGNIIYHPQQQLINSGLKTEKITQVLNAPDRSFLTEDTDKKMYTIATSNITGWKIVSVTNLKEMVMEGEETRKFFIFVMIVSIFSAMLIAVLISKRISRPIKQLELSMKEVEKGNFDIELETKYKHEVGRLSLTFNIMTQKIKELMEQIVEEQKAFRKSEIKALQSQINPHFLYNTLDSIIWMAESEQNDDVIEMTSSLAKLFRISLNKGEETISIAGEIEHVKNYLIIQKMRYKNKLDFIIDADQGILAHKTIKLILQPLVENAIYHGIKNKTGKGLIQILGRLNEDKILFQVIDNGVGMNEEKVQNILLNKHHYNPQGNGVGVKNVHERLQIYYGPEYGLSFQSEVDEGTIVSIWIPAVS